MLIFSNELLYQIMYSLRLQVAKVVASLRMCAPATTVAALWYNKYRNLSRAMSSTFIRQKHGKNKLLQRK